MNHKRRISHLLTVDNFEEDRSPRKKNQQQRTVTATAATMVSVESNFESKLKERLVKDEVAYGVFLECWRLYKGGKKSKHDFCCDIITLFSDEIHDLVPELRSFFKEPSPVGGPKPGVA